MLATTAPTISSGLRIMILCPTPPNKKYYVSGQIDEFAPTPYKLLQ